MKHTSIIELHKDFFDFSAGHFTIFSECDRENLHGHNYHVGMVLHFDVGDTGINFDYRVYKEKLREILKRLDQTTLIATQSPHSKIDVDGDLVYVHFNGEKIPFLKRDVTLLDISNTTVEEISNWILQQFIDDQKSIAEHQIEKIEVKVYSNLSQAGSSCWVRKEGCY
ncbi:MAG: 6-pyruvoyl trahydropterin synthase family protein [Gammaproteobacteria bacterium]